jgi:hypothetical protein
MSAVAKVVACVLFWLLLGTDAHAAGRVILLQPTPSNAEDWPAATRAAIAELALAGFEVTVKRTPRRTLDAVLPELAEATRQPQVVAAVFITRSQDRGTGYVWLAGARSPSEVNETTPDAPISQSAFALKLAELLRKRSWQLPASAPQATPLEKAEAFADFEVAPYHVGSPRLGLGLTWAPGIGTASLASLGAAVTLPAWLSLGLDARFTLSRLEVKTTAGSSSLGWAGFAAQLVFEPLRNRPWQVAGGVSSGPLWMNSRATANAEHVAYDDSARTLVFAALVRAGYRVERFSLALTLEPGLLLPQIQILSQQSELSSIGSSWLHSMLVATWEV